MTPTQHVGGRLIWLLLGVALGCAVLLLRQNAEAATEFASWLRSGTQEARTGAKYRWDVRVLAGQVATHLHHEARLARDTTRLRVARDSALAAAFLLARSVDSLHRAPLTAAVRRFGEACGEQINACDQRRAVLAQALESEHALATAALARAAHADSVIATGLRVTQCKWLLFKCPSRSAVAGVSFVAGAIVAAEVMH